MPKIIIRQGEDAQEIELQEGAQVQFQDYIPEGFLTQQKVDRLIADRVKRAEDAVKTKLLDDESFKSQVFGQHGIKLDQEGKPIGIKTEADVERLKQQIAQATQSEYQQKLQDMQSKLSNTNEQIKRSAILAQAKGLVKDELTSDALGQPLIVMALADRFMVDDSGQVVAKGEDGQPIINAKGQNMSVAEWFNTHKSSDILKPFAKPTSQGQHFGSSGGGVSSDKNPFSKEGWNLTQQTKMMRENPEQAQQLMKQAQ